MSETANLISTLITNLGFPIAVCCYLFYSSNKKDEMHKEEVDAMRASIESNTGVIHEIKIMLNTLVELLKGDVTK